MLVEILTHPDNRDWEMVKLCALSTVGKDSVTAPAMEWKRSILEARHSPIRELHFRFAIHDCPYWVAMHLVRHHVGIQPYVQSQRNDRQELYDRNSAPQDAPVRLIISCNADALIELAKKRLCGLAALETRAVVREMCRLVEESNPEFVGVLKPACEWQGGVCHEMHPCGKLIGYSTAVCTSAPKDDKGG